jgi:hypothetical protein
MHVKSGTVARVSDQRSRPDLRRLVRFSVRQTRGFFESQPEIRSHGELNPGPGAEECHLTNSARDLFALLANNGFES